MLRERDIAQGFRRFLGRDGHDASSVLTDVFPFVQRTL
jgi:hypothetical protein